jgi:hypothetical protein
LAYDHDLETIYPWYYSAYLIDDEVNVSFVPGKKTGIFKFNFPQKASKNVLLGLFNGEGSWEFVNGQEIVATETYQGNIKIHLYGIFSEKGKTGIGARWKAVGRRKSDWKRCQSIHFVS